MSERPRWLSCRTASSAFYECKSLHIPGIRSREVGREGDSEQKREKERMERGVGMRNDFKKPSKGGKGHVSCFHLPCVSYCDFWDILFLWPHGIMLIWRTDGFHIDVFLYLVLFIKWLKMNCKWSVLCACVASDTLIDEATDANLSLSSCPWPCPSAWARLPTEPPGWSPECDGLER